MEQLVLRHARARRFVQDSPILPDVWAAYLNLPKSKPVDLLLTPHWDYRPGEVARELQRRIDLGSSPPREDQASDPRAFVAYNSSVLAAHLRLEELILAVLPMTLWFRYRIVQPVSEDCNGSELTERLRKPSFRNAMSDQIAMPDVGFRSSPPTERPPADLVWLVELVGLLLACRNDGEARIDCLCASDVVPEETRESYERYERLLEERREAATRIVQLACDLLGDLDLPPKGAAKVWAVNRNRVASVSVQHSTLAIKADAARRLFELSCEGIAWAVIDTGVDARHPAFARRNGESSSTDAPPGTFDSRIRKTLDFSVVRFLLARDGPKRLELRCSELESWIENYPLSPLEPAWRHEFDSLEKLAERKRNGSFEELRRSFKTGREVDWSLVEELLEIPHDEAYRPPLDPHGTHVAGILAADWGNVDPTYSRESYTGVCPDLELYDLRVLGPGGTGDEFAVIAALQYVRYLNAHKDYVVLHGVNLSLSIPHSVSNYACGRTPVCEEADRVVSNGVVVVAAAGNRGHLKYMTAEGFLEGYHSISITDPGNTENVITVGATHRREPHTYGVSYFSSRGPTGDGRAKPDLVAPGEKIVSTALDDGECQLDGTSMAAPHVSGAAALLMARHRELCGDPLRIKQILVDTATDLGRERYFQGSGMLDVLRALQAV